MSRCEIIELVNKLFIRNAKIKEVFIKKKKEKITRKERKEHLDQWKLSCELTKIIWHFFPDLSGLLKHLPDHRHQSYIKYGTHVLLMTKILSSIFYISSMRKTSETFNCEHAVQNIGTLCGEDGLSDAPYWETINNYLKELEPERLQEVVGQLVRRLLRMRSFDDARIRGRYWQVILDGTQLLSSRNELPGHCLYRVHNRGKENEYKEYYYYVLEAKLVLGENVVISIMTEFVENMEGEIEKQDCGAT